MVVSTARGWLYDPSAAVVSASSIYYIQYRQPRATSDMEKGHDECHQEAFPEESTF